VREVHDTVLAPVVDAFFATIRSVETAPPFSGEGLVGLLTFPNSGTSWFLRLTARVSGIANHTCYEREARTVKGSPNRGVLSLLVPGQRLPGPGEPSFVKSHVRYYGPVDDVVENARDLAALARRWRNALPPGCDRHVRLVRNPLDNLRARYHLHLEQHADADPATVADFRTFFHADLRRYLQWHAYCDELAATMPVMTVRYEEMLDPARTGEVVGRAMRFAGYRVGEAEIRALASVDPAKYSVTSGVPVHLEHFDEDDIRWVAEEMRAWLNLLADIRRLPPHRRLAAGLKRLFSPGGPSGSSRPPSEA
jgi:hypothetical protein